MSQAPSDKNTPKKTDGGSRIAKVMARAGLCSRREAETWVTAGRVEVNGKTIRTPAFNVIESDKVVVDGNPLAARAGTRVWLYHKPVGLVVTENDPEGRDTIFDALKTHGLPRVLTIGRLDINTEGLLMLTNDGGLKRILELPDTGWLRRYRVRAHGRVTQEQLDKLKNGMEVEGIKYGPIEAELERVQGGNVWITIALREGKNREIKNVLGALGLEVNRLIRTSYGPFQLGDIPVGGVLVVRARVLRDQLGTKLAKLAGVDFDSPLPDDAAGSELAKNPNQRMRKRFDDSLGRAPKPRGRTGEPKPKSETPKGRKNAPERRGNFAPFQHKPKEEKPIEKRIVHFSDGREAAEFEPKAKRKRDDDENDRGYSKGSREGETRPRREGEKRPPRANGDGYQPRRDGEDRPHRANGDGPRPPRREGEARAFRSAGDGPRPQRRNDTDRPKRDGKPGGDHKFGEKPPRREYPKRGDGAARRAIAEERAARDENGGGRPAHARSGPSKTGPARSGPAKSGSGRPPQSRSGPPRGGRPTGGRPGGRSSGPSRGKPTGRGPK